MRFYHGLDPMALTLPQYYGYLDRIADIAEMESGTVDHRAAVERMARRRERGEVV